MDQYDGNEKTQVKVCHIGLDPHTQQLILFSVYDALSDVHEQSWLMRTIRPGEELGVAVRVVGG